MSIQSLAVFCGSKAGNDPVYIEHAKELGQLLAKNNITLIYGGSSKGIMGAVANASLELNGNVIGIIPQVLLEWEHQHKGLTELHEVVDMHVRKSLIYDKSDAAVILPGGYGTLDELFEILTWNQLNIHNKPVFIMNSSGFYNHLIQQLIKMEQQGFLYNPISDKITILNTPAEFLLHMH